MVFLPVKDCQSCVSLRRYGFPQLTSRAVSFFASIALDMFLLNVDRRCPCMTTFYGAGLGVISAYRRWEKASRYQSTVNARGDIRLFLF